MGWGPYGSTGLGENIGADVGTIGSPAIYNAIGKRIDEWPLTPDRILKALGKI